jgi:hypothetical protein
MSLYTYTWYLINDYSLVCDASDLETAQKKIIKDINKLCVEHEKQYYYIKRTHIGNNDYYIINEKCIRYKLLTILTVLQNITKEEANKKINSCYHYSDYAIINKIVTNFIKNTYPIIEI